MRIEFLSNTFSAIEGDGVLGFLRLFGGLGGGIEIVVL